MAAPHVGAEAQPVSTTEMHTQTTLGSAARAGMQDDAVALLDANLDRDRGLWRLLNNEDHFDYGTRDAFAKFSKQAYATAASGDRAAFLRASGSALHHLQDQYALGHMFPGTSLLKGPLGAPFRFIVHNVVGGEVTFRQASERASLQFLQSLRSAPL
jgi:hypothetical protein